jgi:hypothetical protein
MSSGGPIYHAKALLFKQKLWRRHREALQKFLEAWNPVEKNLVLIGPSGGYSLPEDFLNRFERLIVIDPDPIARFIFAKRFSRETEWMMKFIDFKDPKPFFESLPPNSAILFCNLLGQIAFKNAAQTGAKLLDALQARNFASYHDALSGEDVDFDTELAPPGKRLTMNGMKGLVYPKVRSGTITLNSHQAPELFQHAENLKYFYWQWQITPKRAHLIEGVFQTQR